jgi:cell division protease FtsH
MVTKYGMSDKIGLVNYDQDEGNEVFLGRDFGHTKTYSESVAQEIDDEVRRIIAECHAEAKRLISEHRYVLDECARQLMIHEKIGRKDFEQIFEQEKNGAAEEDTTSYPVSEDSGEDKIAAAKKMPEERRGAFPNLGELQTAE